MNNNKLFLVAIAALMLAGCSSETDFSQADVQKALEAQDVPVAFGTYLGATSKTRATNPASNGFHIDTNTELQASGFGVFSYLTSGNYAGTTAPNFMYNQQVTYSGNWTYSPVKYWPNGTDAANGSGSPSNTATESSTQKLSFFAYAPYVSGNGTLGTDDGIITLPTNTATERPIITYKLPTTPTASNTVDLLWGVRGQLTYDETDGENNSIATLGTAYNTDLTKQTIDERVKFLFKHALAKIGAIKVVADIDGNSALPTSSGFGSLDAKTLITLEEISIKDNGGTVVTKNNFDISQGTWSTAPGDITKASPGANVAADIKAKSSRTAGIEATLWELESDNPAYSGSAWTSPGTGVPANTPADIYSSGYSPIMFIPGSGQQLSITVKYVVRTYDANLNASVSSGGEGTWSKVTQTITNTISLPDLQPNTNYNLVLHLGMTSVKFSAEVSGWDDSSTEVIWLPSNVAAITVASGNSGSANVAANATSFTINLTGATDTHAFTATISASDSSPASISPASGSFSGTTQAFTATLTANGGSARTYTVTITDTTTSSVTTVTITQAAGA